MRKITFWLIIALAAIAAIVFIGQVLHLNMWAWICAYWLVLTAKNCVDVRGRRNG